MEAFFSQNIIDIFNSIERHEKGFSFSKQVEAVKVEKSVNTRDKCWCCSFCPICKSLFSLLKRFSLEFWLFSRCGCQQPRLRWWSSWMVSSPGVKCLKTFFSLVNDEEAK